MFKPKHPDLPLTSYLPRLQSLPLHRNHLGFVEAMHLRLQREESHSKATSVP